MSERLAVPDIELKPPEASPDSRGVLRGVEAVRRFLEPDIFEWMNFEVQGVLENGDRCLVEGNVRAMARGSGVEVNQVVYHVWTIREGRGHRLEIHVDRPGALEAAGLGTD